MGADYSFYVKSIATCAPTFFSYIILHSVLHRIDKTLSILLLYHYLLGDTQGPNMLRHVVALRKQRAALTFHLITTLVALNEVNKELENMLLNSRAGIVVYILHMTV
jgi:hypothetical protein